MYTANSWALILFKFLWWVLPYNWKYLQLTCNVIDDKLGSRTLISLLAFDFSHLFFILFFFYLCLFLGLFISFVDLLAIKLFVLFCYFRDCLRVYSIYVYPTAIYPVIYNLRILQECTSIFSPPRFYAFIVIHLTVTYVLNPTIHSFNFCLDGQISYKEI